MELAYKHHIKFELGWMKQSLVRIDKNIAQNKDEWLDGFFRGQKATLEGIVESMETEES